MALSDNLVAYYKLGEASGTRADSSGLDNDLSPINSPASAAGKVGDALSCVSASSQYLQRSAVTDLGNLSAFTVAFWFKPTTVNEAASQTYFVLATADGAANIVAFTLLSAGTPGRGVLTLSGGLTGFNISSPDPFVAGTWYFCVVWNDPANAVYGAQINAGTPQTVAGAASPTQEASPLLRLGNNRTATAPANGLIDECGIWTRALTADERAELYNGGSGITLPLADDYAAWPGTEEIAELLASVDVELREDVTTARQQAVLNAVIREVFDRTKRDFVTVSEVRYFDGSGTPEMDIDEFVSITLVRALWSNTTGTGLTLNAVIDLPQNGYPNSRIAMYRGGLPTLGGYLVDRFPAGRGNIEVTATWGYGATIPADLWEAVAMEAAARLVDEAGFILAGRLASYRDDDVSETYHFVSGNADPRISAWNGWHMNFDKTVARYRRTGTRQARKMRPVMV